MSGYISKGQVIEGVAQTFLDQIKTASDEWATPDDVTSVTVSSFDLSNDAHILTTTLDKEEAILDEQSFAYGWNEDDEGFNGLIVAPGEHWPLGDRTYRLQIVYQFVSGAPRIRIYELQCIRVYSTG